MSYRSTSRRRAFVFMLAVVAAPVALTGVAHGQGRPDTRTMTCGEINALVKQSGAIVMTTGPNTFQRFVASTASCDRWQVLRPERAPSSGGACTVQYVCEDAARRGSN